MATLPKTKPAKTVEPDKGAAEKPEARNFIAEWAVTILMLLFGTSTLLQAFVVPTGSMENTVLIGDHMIVDKLAYAPAGSISRHFLPYTEVKRGDIIVFRYPLEINQNYVKRVVGVPGDHIHIVDKQVFINGKAVNEPYKVVIKDQLSNYLNNFPQPLDIQIYPRGREMLRDNVVNGELVVPAGFYFAMGDNRDNSADSRFWGDYHLLVLRCPHRTPRGRQHQRGPHHGPGAALLHQDPLGSYPETCPRLSALRNNA